MRVKKLSLKNFRNIKELCLEPCETANVICADNASGKTNLLEAIWLFSGAKSFRGAKESKFIKKEQEIADINILFHAENREQSATLRYGREEKYIGLNEIKQKSMREMLGVFQAVVFSPDHLWIVKHEPKRRRKLIDTALCQIYPKYGKALDGYERILRQRAFLLKDVAYNALLTETLEAFDIQAARYGGYISHMRFKYVESLSRHAGIIYDGLAGGKEILTISYVPGFSVADGVPTEKDQWKNSLLDALYHSRSEDIRYGNTSKGPHRDDILIEIGGMSAKSFASQGQQRSCILALKLAECELLSAAAEEPPVILLDDVMSELDKNRREYLLNHIVGKQVFITCCDRSAYEGLGSGVVWNMKDGNLKEGEC